MTVEEKAKAYDEAIKVAKSKIKNDKDHVLYEEDITDIFPELAESEDERVRKALISFLKSPFVSENITDEKVTPWIAWLEKQGKINPSEDELEALRIAAYEPYKNWNEKLQSLYEKLIHCKRYENRFEWSEEDELHIKELERLVKQVWAIAEHENDKESIHKMSDLSFFLKTLKPQPQPKEWSEEDEERLSDAIFFVREYQIPTRDKRLLNAAKETEDWLRTFKDKVQSKQDWSEEDERCLTNAIDACKQMSDEDYDYSQGYIDAINWLKSLKDRVQPKQEWSEDDEAKRKFIEDELSGLIADENAIESPLTKRVKDLYSALYWLKSFRPQKQWRPSETELRIFEEVIDGVANPYNYHATLHAMLEQLKKLSIK